MEDLTSNMVIVAEPGTLRDSLHALVSALPQVNIICETEDIAEALQVVTQHFPDLVLLGGDFPADEMWVFLRLIRKRSPRTLRLILADTVGQKMEMEAPGAEAILLNGATPVELVTDIERLLADRPNAARPT
jgi:DNA-binding NarL/FixJ family response regulator